MIWVGIDRVVIVSIPKKSKTKQIFIDRIRNDQVRYHQVRNNRVRNNRVRNDSTPVPYLVMYCTYF